MVASAEIESSEALEASDVETAPVGAGNSVPAVPIEVTIKNPEVAPIPTLSPTLSSKSFDWTFIKSNAFYAVLVGSASITLVDPAFQTNKWYVSLGKFLGLVAAGFWGTRTIDRVTDKVAQ